MTALSRPIPFPAPNRWHVDLTGAELLSPTGWLRIPALAIDEAVTTDFETLYAEAVTRVAEQDFGEDQPYFEELNIRIALPAEDRALGWGDEVLSLREAMHEDVYFSLSEIFQARTSGDSTRAVGPARTNRAADFALWRHAVGACRNPAAFRERTVATLAEACHGNPSPGNGSGAARTRRAGRAIPSGALARRTRGAGRLPTGFGCRCDHQRRATCQRNHGSRRCLAGRAGAGAKAGRAFLRLAG